MRHNHPAIARHGVLPGGLRDVNGAAILYLQVGMIADGVPLVYVFHAHAGPRGTIQVLAYTGKTPFDELRKDMEDLVDGLVVRD